MLDVARWVGVAAGPVGLDHRCFLMVRSLWPDGMPARVPDGADDFGEQFHAPFPSGA